MTPAFALGRVVIKNMLGSALAGFLTAYVAFGAAAQTTDWQKTWDETLAAAKKEGKVTVAGSPDPVMRNKVIPAFQARYGIQVEYIGGPSSQTAARIRVERGSGIFSIDVYLTGPDTTYNVLLAEKMLDPLRPFLILPEVTESKNWKTGKLWFMDEEDRYVLRLFSSIIDQPFINTAFVDPSELKTVHDLLNPKWKGKISTEDPTNDSGKGGNVAANIYAQLGPEFTQRLYVDQAVMSSRDRRQLTDWLARGTYPICLTCRADDAAALMKEGYKLLELRDIAGIDPYVNASPFLLSVANKAPHPNAARIFLNWMAGKEAMEIYSHNYNTVSLRTDIDESVIDPHLIPRPGVNYRDADALEWRTKEKRQISAKVRALIKEQFSQTGR
jgi:iron(III) transport system substrate-binding protein